MLLNINKEKYFKNRRNKRNYVFYIKSIILKLRIDETIYYFLENF